jgi:hypothetical protein
MTGAFVYRITGFGRAVTGPTVALTLVFKDESAVLFNLIVLEEVKFDA